MDEIHLACNLLQSAADDGERHGIDTAWETKERVVVALTGAPNGERLLRRGARMAARDSQLPVECKPILSEGGTDSTSLDEAIELLSQNGRPLPEAIRMLVPPAAILGAVSPTWIESTAPPNGLMLLPMLQQ